MDWYGQTKSENSLPPSSSLLCCFHFMYSLDKTRKLKAIPSKTKEFPLRMPILIRESDNFFFPQMRHEQLLFPAILKLLRHLAAVGTASRLPGFWWTQTSLPSLWLTGDKPSTIWVSLSELPQLSNAPCQSTEPIVISQISPGNS